MPVPLYVTCSESGSVDQATNKASAFNLIESVQLAERQSGDDKPKPLQLRVVASWAREATDADVLYEANFSLTYPDGLEHPSNIALKFYLRTPVQRVVVHLLEIETFAMPGVLRLEAKLRRVEPLPEGEWIARQSCGFVLIEPQKNKPAT